MDEHRAWIGYGGEQAFFWRGANNRFPLGTVKGKWRLAAVYVGDVAVHKDTDMRDLFLLGCGTGTFEDPLIVRGELATDNSEEMYYCEAAPGQIAAFNLTGNRQVQLWQIAKHFGLWPWTAWICGAGREGKLQIDQVQHSSGNMGSSEDPFQIKGYYGPFSKGDLGSFCSSLGPKDQGVLDLEIVEPLHISFSVAVYGAFTSTGEQVVLKLDYDPNRNLNLKIRLEGAALSDLQDKGIMSPSLPVLVREGYYHPRGSLQCEFGDVCGLVTKPLGRGTAEEMAFHGKKLCKVAFDILLALYHLHLVGRKHRDVRPQNIVIIGDDQFMLVDLEFAYLVDIEHLYTDRNEAAASDCHKLLSCLVQLSGHQRVIDDPEITIEVLQREEDVLGDFAKYLLGLPHAAWPDFRLWLTTIAARGYNLSQEYVENAVAGRISSETFALRPPLASAARYPSEAVWVTCQGQTGFFSPAHGRFPLARVKHVWNLCQVSIGGVLLDGEHAVSDLCCGLHGRGSRADPFRITGKPGVPRFIRCQEDIPEVQAALRNLGPRQDSSCFAGLSQVLASYAVKSYGKGNGD